MTEKIKAYRSHLRYWALILTTVVVFGGLLGGAGAHRIQNLPTLAVMDSSTKTLIITRTDANASRIDSSDIRLTTLEHRVTDIEHDRAAAHSVKAK